MSDFNFGVRIIESLMREERPLNPFAYDQKADPNMTEIMPGLYMMGIPPTSCRASRKKRRNGNTRWSLCRHPKIKPTTVWLFAKNRPKKEPSRERSKKEFAIHIWHKCMAAAQRSSGHSLRGEKSPPIARQIKVLSERKK